MRLKKHASTGVWVIMRSPFRRNGNWKEASGIYIDGFKGADGGEGGGGGGLAHLGRNLTHLDNYFNHIVFIMLSSCIDTD